MKKGKLLTLSSLTIDSEHNLVKYKNEIIQLEPKCVKVLFVLAENINRPVTREVIIDKIWFDHAIGEYSLNRAISQLRKALEINKELKIKTIRGIGYQLMLKEEAQTSQHITKKKATNLTGVISVFSVLVLFVIYLLFFRNTEEAKNESPISLLEFPVTSEIGIEHSLAVSPDDKFMAYSWAKENVNKWNVYIKQIGFNEASQFSYGDYLDISPAWSNDGNYLAYFQKLSKGWALKLRPVYGSNERTLITLKDVPGTGINIVWNKDDKSIFFVGKTEDSDFHMLWRIDTKNLQLNKVLGKEMINYNSPRVSPDGTMLAFISDLSDVNFSRSRDKKSPTSISILNLSTWEVIFERKFEYSISGFDWKSNSSFLFTGNSCVNCSIFLLSTEENSQPISIKNSNYSIRNIDYSPKSDRIYIEKWTADVNIWKATYDGDLLTNSRFIASTQFDFSPTLNKKANKIAFVSDRTGSMQIWTYDLSTNKSERLTNFENNKIIKSISWSNSGNQIAINFTSSDSLSYISIINKYGVVERNIGMPTGALYPSWSENDKYIYASTSRADNISRIWKYSFQEDEWQVYLGKNTIYGKEYGNYFYFVRNDKNGLWRSPVSSPKDSVKLTDKLDRFRFAFWTISGDTLKTINLEGQSVSSIELVNLKNDKLINSYRLNNFVPMVEPGATYIENNVFFSSIDNYESDIFGIEFRE